MELALHFIYTYYYCYYIRYTSVIAIILIFSLNIQVQTMDFGRQRGFLLDGEDLSEKVGCRKESYCQEFMYVDIAWDFAIIIIITIITKYYHYYYYYY